MADWGSTGYGSGKTKMHEVRQLILDRESFEARSMVGEWVDGVIPTGSEELVGDDADRFQEDAPTINYIVFSYEIPIHWVTLDGRSYTIKYPPSKTTTGHRNRCPGYKPYPR